MWFKQAQLFKIEDESPLDAKELENQLEQLAFTPCPQGLPITKGWIAPTEEDTALVYAVKDFLLICLQTEAKLLPTTIVRQKLNEKIKIIESNQAKKITYKEKSILKQEIYNELLPQAFGVLYRTYAFIDTKNNWLILDTNNAKRTENFLTFFKRSVSKTKITSPEIKQLSPLLTGWLMHDTLPKSLNIEDACVLQDPKQTERKIRIQRQDLSANYVQPILKNDFEISQIKMTWNDQVTFVLKNDFTLQSLQYQDSIVELTNEDKNDAEEKSFRTDFFIMSGLLTKMFQELLKILIPTV